MTITVNKTAGRLVMLGLLILAAAVAFSACGATPTNVNDRNEAIGGLAEKTNYLEAKQINEIEKWKDQPGKIVTWYIEFPPESGNVLTLQCRGVPTSSTESLEPNIGDPWGSIDGWRIPNPGDYDIWTQELAGRDGTFGDPVPYRQCFTVDGQYIDVPAIGVPYMVSSGLYTFAPSTVQRDFESEVRLLQAERLIAEGRCVNPETLVEIPCPQGADFSAPAPAPVAPTDPALVNQTPTPAQ